MDKKKRNPERIAFSLVTTGHWQNRILASFCCLPLSFCSSHEPEDTFVGPFCFCPCPSLPSTDPRVCPVHCEIDVSVLHSGCHLRHVLLCSGATALGNSKTQANSRFQIRNQEHPLGRNTKKLPNLWSSFKDCKRNDCFEYTHGYPERLFLLLLFLSAFFYIFLLFIFFCFLM